ncbi:MAG: hypothetical protein KC502_07755 [Myxococcales bacterium]|nr:hypothetical protein [Myxococcales bacterium]
MELLTAIVPGRTYILCLRDGSYEGKIIRKSDRIIEVVCDGKLLRLDARQLRAVLEPRVSPRADPRVA